MADKEKEKKVSDSKSIKKDLIVLFGNREMIALIDFNN